jgi:hypothetical protein
LKNFDEGKYDSRNVEIQYEAGWFDWFCKDSSLRNKTYALTAKLKQIVSSPKINPATMYVLFKNNCPCYGKLYDDFRFCDMITGDVIYTVVPAGGNRQAEVWGKENDFKEALVEGTWNDVLFFFLGIDKKKEREEKRIAAENRKKGKERLKDERAVRKYLVNQIENKTVPSDEWFNFDTVELVKIASKL